MSEWTVFCIRNIDSFPISIEQYCKKVSKKWKKINVFTYKNAKLFTGKKTLLQV